MYYLMVAKRMHNQTRPKVLGTGSLSLERVRVVESTYSIQNTFLGSVVGQIRPPGESATEGWLVHQDFADLCWKYMQTGAIQAVMVC